MITVRLNGGLGNQLFQYSTARALAFKHCVPLRIDCSNYEFYDVHPFRLKFLRCSGEFSAKTGLLNRYLNNIKFIRWLKLLGLARKNYLESSLEYDEKICELDSDARLYGYFQTEKYFLNIRHLLLAELMPNDSQVSKISDQVEEIRRSQCISLHIRRGDYVSNPAASQIHGVCELDYYYDAISYIKSVRSVDKAVVYVFSDDIEWCRKNLTLDDDVRYITGFDDEPELDLYLMSCCTDNVISNSTFSWWAAWLNCNANKIVVAPDGDQRRDDA